MKTTIQKLSLTFACLTPLIFMSGCAITNHARDFSGLTTPYGEASHLNTSKYALHILFGTYPLIGDASIEQTVADFTLAAKEDGASQVRIVQSDKMNWWFIFPPFSFLLTPVSTNVAGDAIR
ncbi:MAG: hypothetical protein V3U88_10745 [Methylococcales bacterium]